MASEINLSDNEVVETVHDPHHTQDTTHIRTQIAEIENGIENLDLGNPSHTDGQREYLRSDQVWQHFESRQGEDGTERAICKYCTKELDGSINIGTKHLQKHFERCATKRNIGGRDGDYKPAEVGNWLTNPAVMLKSWIAAEVGNWLTNPAVMLKSWVDAARRIFKNGDTSSLALIESDDLIQVYEEEKERLGTYLKNLPCHLHLSILKHQRYFLFKIHFIDEDWKMKEKVISVKRIEEDSSILKCLKDVLLEWGIDRNVCSINFNGYVNVAEDVMSSNEIKSRLTDRGSLPFAGKFLFIHSLRDIESKYQSLGGNLDWEVSRMINPIFYYVWESSSNEQNFQIAIERAVSLGREVTAEVVFPKEDEYYYDTLDYLEIAIGYKEAFVELENIDTEFKSRNLTTEEWDQAPAFFNDFKEFCHDDFDSSTYDTSSMGFVLLCELYTRSFLLSKFDLFFGDAEEICNRFRNIMDEYWSKNNMALAAAAVLDPRFKLGIVEDWYKKIYNGDEKQFTLFIDYFTNVYNEYARLDSSGKQLYDSSTSCTKLHPSWTPSKSSNTLNGIPSPASELDFYLKEEKLDSIKECDALNWWRVNKQYFPTLARMARDILSINRSNYNDDNPWSDLDEVLGNNIHSDMNKNAFICTSSWLKSP